VLPSRAHQVRGEAVPAAGPGLAGAYQRACVPTGESMESTHDLTPETLAKLMGIVAGDEREAADTRRQDRAADLLTCWLGWPWPVRTPVADAKPRRPPETLEQNGKATTIAQLLLGERSGLGVLCEIKEFAKRLARRNKAEPGHSVATAIYYAAIASALLHHGRKITAHSHRSLEASFLRLMAEPWLPAALYEHLGQACRFCGGRT